MPETIQREDIKQVPLLMDLYESGFFIHTFGTFKTANLIFDIPSVYSGTEKESLLISLIIDSKSKINSVLTQEFLKGFVEEFKKIKENFKAFYMDSRIYKGDSTKLKEIRELLNTFYISFPEEEVIFEQKEAKILIFGLSLAGKTTIIRTRRKSVSKTVFPTINVDISKILVNNLSLLTYDIPGKYKVKEIWKPYLKNQDGLIFVLDVTDEIKFSYARELLHEIAGKPELSELPLLILFNKIDLKQLDIKDLEEAMGVKRLGKRPMKSFLTSGIKNLNIDEAFNWLSLKIAERVDHYAPKREVGIIFCRWDENLGIKIEAVHPKDAFENPELISIKSFSISQLIFGGDEFRPTSVILPFPHLNSNAAIYIDYVHNERIRGGLLPLSLIIYYNEKIPKNIINQFSSFILNQFDDIKKDYSNKKQVVAILESIHNTIINQISLYKPSIQALKMAELRYEALFKAARDAILIIEKKSGIIIDVNKEAEDLFQRPFEDFIGLHSSQILSGIINIDFNEEVFDQLDYPFPLRLEVIDNSGNLIPVEISVNEVQMGGQIFVQYIIRDISQRVEAEIKLKHSEIKYRHLFKESPFSILLIDPKGSLVDFNPALEETLGYTREELMGEKFVDLSLIHQDYMVEVLKRLKKEERGKYFPPLEIQLFQKNGNLIWVNMQSSLVEIGDETFYQIICQNITEEKKIEQELMKISRLKTIITGIVSRFVGILDFNQAIIASLRDIGQFVNATRVYLYILNENFNFIKRNYVWYSKVIYPQIALPENIQMNNFPWLTEKLLKSDYLYIKNVDSLPTEAVNLKFFLDNQRAKNFLTFSVKINGILEAIISFDNIKDRDYWIEENLDLLSIISDILKNVLLRKLAEEHLRISEETIHQDFDREYFYKELFVNDINSIIKNIQLSLNEYEKADNQIILKSKREILENVKDQCINSKLLIDIILKLTMINQTNFLIEPVNLNNVIVDVKDFITNSYSNKRINITVEQPSEELYVKADKFLIDVFVNILISSIRYNPNPVIELKIIIFRSHQDNTNFIKVKFIDYQKEILNIEKELIFQKEREKDSKIKEIILGFLLVEEILNNYNGKIWVEGDSFVILLPEA
ncbi:MAG: PAS domain S-box protein [Promethearchaeota archaeon]|jgi:PAS domain S-box-containing protein/small GTP-binding protein